MQRRPTAVLTDGGGDSPLDPRAIEIYAWRVEQLVRAGYSNSLAHELAENGDVDLHVACNLLVQGCPEPTAHAILA